MGTHGWGRISVVALALSFVLLVGRADVRVGASTPENNDDVQKELESTLQESLKGMSCQEMKVFIREKIVKTSSNPELTAAAATATATTEVGGCEKAKQFIHDFVAKSFTTATSSDSEIVPTGHSWFPPLACIRCGASLCLDSTRCETCCHKGRTTYCYDCP